MAQADRYLISPMKADTKNNSGCLLICSPVAQSVDQTADNRRVDGSNPARGATLAFAIALFSIALGASACSDTARTQQLNARCQAGDQASCAELDTEQQKQALHKYPQGPPAMLAPPGSGMFGVQ